jgi:tripartite-type tricarboxylate transporter receptor subunit TctC
LAKGTPHAIVEKLNTAIVEVMNTPEIAEKMRTTGNIIVSSTPEKLGNEIRYEIEKWGPLHKVSRDFDGVGIG